MNDSMVKKVPTKMLNQPFETTFRLQVNYSLNLSRGKGPFPKSGNWPVSSFQVRLPRNQLYVARVNPKTTIGQVLAMVCHDKNISEDKYEIRHPGTKTRNFLPLLLRYSVCSTVLFRTRSKKWFILGRKRDLPFLHGYSMTIIRFLKSIIFPCLLSKRKFVASFLG